MRGTGFIVGLVLAAIAIIVAAAALFTVREDELVLVRRFGEPKRVIADPGLKVKVPIVDSATFFSKRLLTYDGDPQEIPTVDQKQMIVDAFARFRITDPLRFFQSVGTEAGMQARLGNIVNSALRGVLGDVPLSRVLTEQRSVLMKEITQWADESAQQFGIEVADVRMKRVDLPEENSQAVFRRMQTQREQEARRFRAEGDREARRIRAEADKQQRVIIAEARRQSEILRGEGDAEAQSIYTAAYSRDVDFFDFWRSMQAMERGLNPQATTYVGPPGGDFFRYFSDETGGQDRSDLREAGGALKKAGGG